MRSGWPGLSTCSRRHRAPRLSTGIAATKRRGGVLHLHSLRHPHDASVRRGLRRRGPCGGVSSAGHVSVTVGIVADLAAGNFGGVSRFAEGLLQSLLAQPGDGLRYVLFLADDRRTWPDPQRDDVRAVPVGPHGLPHGWRQWVERLDRYGAVALCAARGDLQAARIARLWRARQRRLARALACSPWKLDVLHFPFQD